MFSEAALSTGPLDLLPFSSCICLLTSLTFARNPLILTRYCQSNPLHLSLNPFPFQPIFHSFHQHLLDHALFRPSHLTLLKNAPASSWSSQAVKSVSTHTLQPSPALTPMPIAIDNGLPHITVSLGSDPTLDLTLCGLMDTPVVPIILVI